MEAFTGALSCPPGSAWPQQGEPRTIPRGGGTSARALWRAAPGPGGCRQVPADVGWPSMGEHHAVVAVWEGTGRAAHLLTAAWIDGGPGWHLSSRPATIPIKHTTRPGKSREI